MALTAHATTADHDACFAAGMDGYLSKPIDTETLLATVEGSAAAADIAPWAPASADGGDGPLFDRAALSARLGGDAVLIREVAQMFVEDATGRIDEIRAATEARDAAALRRAAHTLKGAAATIASDRVAADARRLELIGTSGDFALAEAALASLERDGAALLTSLEAVIQEDSPCAR